MKEYYVYLYRDPSRGMEPIYVGKGKGLRYKDHLSRKDHHPLTYRLRKMRREGTTPDIIFVCKDVDEELAHLVEMEAISKYGRRDLGKGPLLNLTDGGEGTSGYSPVFTDEHRRKISASRKGNGSIQTPEAVEKRRQANLGKKRSPEVRELLSQQKKGKPFSEAHKQALRDAKRKKRELAAASSAFATNH